MNRIELKPCKRCGALSPKPLRRDGRGRVDRWPGSQRGFLCDACIAGHGKGQNHFRWAGGRSTTNKSGYVRVWTGPGRERDLEHRVVWAQANGLIPAGMHVHHRNGDKTDNRLENLMLVGNAAHQAIHRRDRSLNGRWSFVADRCASCGTATSPHKARGLCKPCYDRLFYKSKAGQRSRPSGARRPKDGRWSLQHARCTACGTTERRHEAKGLCQRCYAARQHR